MDYIEVCFKAMALSQEPIEENHNKLGLKA